VSLHVCFGQGCIASHFRARHPLRTRRIHRRYLPLASAVFFSCASAHALSLARTPASLSLGLKLNYFLNMCLSSQSPHTSTRALQAPPHAHARTHIRAHPRTPAHTHTHVRTHTNTFKHAHADNCLGASCARMCSLTRMCFLTSMCSLTHADSRLGETY
jgi:hypothetical protein